MVEILFALLLMFNGGLELDPVLSEQAQHRADLLVSQPLAHDLQPYLAPGRCAVGEVLSRGLGPGEAFVGWWYSPTHRQVMTDPAFDDVGVGISDDVIVVAFSGEC